MARKKIKEVTTLPGSLDEIRNEYDRADRVVEAARAAHVKAVQDRSEIAERLRKAVRVVLGDAEIED